MAYRKYKLGELIEQYDEINQSAEFTDLESLQVINSNKYFQECKSNKNDIDLHRYRICRKGMFAYNRATSRNGEKISIAYRTEADCLISPSYYVFRIVREDLLDPEYLMIWLKRPIFDRYARFNSWGSATEFFTFEDFCDTEIFLPSIEEQRKIVHDYKVVMDRINLLKKINENLDGQLSAVYHRIFDDDSLFEDGTVGDFGTIVAGATPSTDVPEYFCENGIHWLSPNDLTSTGLRFISKGKTDITQGAYDSCSTKMLPKDTVLMTSRAPVGTVAIAENDVCTNQGFKSIIPNKRFGMAYVYCFLKENKALLDANSSGTTFMEISGSVLRDLKTKLPPKVLIEKFQSIAIPMLNMQRSYEHEISALSNMSEQILSLLANN